MPRVGRGLRAEHLRAGHLRPGAVGWPAQRQERCEQAAVDAIHGAGGREGALIREQRGAVSVGLGDGHPTVLPMGQIFPGGPPPTSLKSC